MVKVKSFFHVWETIEPDKAKEFACWLVAQSMQSTDDAIKSANNRLDGVQITEEDYFEYLMRTKADVNVK